MLKAGFLIAAALSAAAPDGHQAAPLLTASDLDPAHVLPAPPLPSSPQAQAELAELHAIERTRTPKEEAAARLEGETKNGTIFAEVLGPRFDLGALPATAHLLNLVRASEKAAVNRGKEMFRRPRPYAVDPTLKSCKRNDDPLSSNPSGHTAMAFSMAETLAQLVADKAGALLGRATQYGQSRIVCEQHFRSDLTAGQAIGTLIAQLLMSKPTFRQAYYQARRELLEQGIARPGY